MAAIHSRNTKLELRVRRAVHANGFRYRIHEKYLTGKPDLVFPRYKLIVFVHGCYWHGHVCKEAKRPSTNLSYWTPKIDGNMTRDARVTSDLEAAGWEVFVVRECTANEDTAALVEHLRNKKAERTA